MEQRTRFTIQEIIDDLRMTSTTERYPIKAKSLTLLELCQTINDLRHISSRNTSQILTRRLYLHPLTISTNAKLHSSKIIPNTSIDIEQINQLNLKKRNSSRKHKSYSGLAILSSSLPLMTRVNTKTHTSINTDNDTITEYDASTTTISSNSLHLPTINRSTPSSSSKRALSTRSSYIMNQQKNNNVNHNRLEKVDVWHHLAYTLQRPTPKDPPTTPLDVLSDFHLQNVEQQSNYNSIQEIKIYKKSPVCDLIINENDSNDED